ncbi:pyridoxamine 5'-phosphate oxidase family protein [Luteimicrobium subarcticum]|uniref:Pyridoxamine 5'-phosphate oxidase n=1 Tax=Luteimicrobium subarcticum TaxID=620910 RepID=A0A2M8WQW3_9MICO|nr:pyridoxamine 5'-phosphate oxidase family protein [Luteimicrobium subarcticum]PJI93318.1 pyridoxamine 5'-phosphate oxidase [Luteimicrobium subarcticum]
MDQHEIDAELSAAPDLLEATSAHLAYTAQDGTPRVVPVGIYWTGTELVVATGTEAPKVAAITARPDVALAIDGAGGAGAPDQTRTLSVRGRADVRIVDGVVEEYLAASRKSMAPDAAAAFEKACRAMYPRMARIGITPTWARYFDFGTGRIPGFLQDLAERAQPADGAGE